jgi:hypothetical protein
MKASLTSKNPTGSFTPPPPSLLANSAVKGTTTFLVSLLFAAALLFASCGDLFGDKDKDGDSGNSGNNTDNNNGGNNTGNNNGGNNTGGNSGGSAAGNNNGPMNPQNAYVYLEGSAFPTPGINADVFMYIWGGNSEDGYFEMILPTPIGRITDGRLSFTLPNVSAYADKGGLFAESFGIGNISEYNRPEGDIKTVTSPYGYGTYTSTVTKNTMVVDVPQDAKVLEGEFGFTHEGKDYGLVYDRRSWQEYSDDGMHLYYFNKPVTFKGEFNTTNNYGSSSIYNYNETYNWTLTAGWNFYYKKTTIDHDDKDDGQTVTYTYSATTNPPANARWIAW